ncbi:alpha/beta hydrolase-fold protein [Kribbella pratensis]|uniref:Enterochelin esterase-like enzyme n=1 Tax=Kribbella pratensis TaxID=2512112 RepID=A0A4R8BY46_9ACTN|nr:alpha/beta hydrolase-fold protein [Kribbella pratensis]TDW66506.1 enterochelin esterase-like enzyme [Kribbella pratensis]
MRKLLLPALTAATLVGSFVVPGSAAMPAGSAGSPVPAVEPGVIKSAAVRSATLGEDINYNVYLPAGYDASARRYPVVYLLHGRGDSMSAWTQVKSRLDELIGVGEIPPTIAVMPDAPWSSRASWYVDSAYTGSDPARPVETAFFRDFVPQIDATYRTIADRSGRAIAGYSMGGAGALRYSLAHPEVFGAAIALSPAVYFPLPPADSSTRDFGAFGKGKDPFVEATYLKLNWPAALKSFSATGLKSHLYIAVGDDEYKNPKAIDATHDLDFEAHVVFNQASRVPNLTSEFRVVDGGHDWDVWGPTFAEGARYIFRYIGKPPAVPMHAAMTGTAGDDRAGGIATDASGNVYQAVAVAGSLDGQPYAGGTDVALIKYRADGSREWTRSLGTSGTERAYGVAVDADGRVVVTGYTNGDLDGTHTGNATDDGFVAQYDADGNRRWLTQFGVPGVADRSYSVTVSGTDVYVGGYTKGALDGANQGDKDVFVARLDGDGRLVWLRQTGTAGEDKGMAVAVSDGSVYLGGMMAGDGGVDGLLARYSTDGAPMWVKQLGTPAADEVWAITADPDGGVYLAGYTAGDFAGTLNGDKDFLIARADSDGNLTWRDQLGTSTNDKAAAVAVDPAGNLYVAGFTDGSLETPLGKFDGVLTKYSPDHTRSWTRQFGTADDDAADAFAEANLYLTVTPTGTQLSGLSGTDVFRTAFTSDGSNTLP